MRHTEVPVGLESSSAVRGDRSWQRDAGRGVFQNCRKGRNAARGSGDLHAEGISDFHRLTVGYEPRDLHPVSDLDCRREAWNIGRKEILVETEDQRTHH